MRVCPARKPFQQTLHRCRADPGGKRAAGRACPTGAAWHRMDKCLFILLKTPLAAPPLQRCGQQQALPHCILHASSTLAVRQRHQRALVGWGPHAGPLRGAQLL